MQTFKKAVQIFKEILDWIKTELQYIFYKDNQYKFLNILCRLSRGLDWPSHEQIEKKWSVFPWCKCPSKTVILNLANDTYVQTKHEGDQITYFPNPEAFTYVRQCRDSFRNLVVTTVTLLVSVGALLTALYPLLKPFFQ